MIRANKLKNKEKLYYSIFRFFFNTYNKTQYKFTYGIYVQYR